MQVDWENAAKSDAGALPRIARELRERTRRALLSEYAPTSVQNDWAGDPVSASDRRGEPLERLHPVTAQGIVAFVNDATRSIPRRALLDLYPVLRSVEATAELVTVEPPIPTGA